MLEVAVSGVDLSQRDIDARKSNASADEKVNLKSVWNGQA